MTATRRSFKATLRKLCVLCLLSVVFTSLFACGNHGYELDWIIGKNSAEVQERYGDFDIADAEFDDEGAYRNQDGLYRTYRCGYILKEKRVGPLGTTPETILLIFFDHNGIATDAEIREGRIGG